MTESNLKATKTDPNRRRLLKGAAAGGMLAGTGLLGARTSAAADPVRLGVLAPLSHFTGTDVERAIRMAVDEVNEAGGIAGREVEIVVADSEGAPEKAIQAIQHLAVRSEVHAVIGGFRSGAVLATLPFIARFRLPFIVTGAASPDITLPVKEDYDAHKYVFRAWIDAQKQAVGLGSVLNDVMKDQAGITRYAIDAEAYKWAADYSSVLKGEMEKHGLELMYETSHDPSIKDFTPIFQNAIDAKAEALIMIISNEAGYIIDRQWASQKVPLALCGNNNASFQLSSFWQDTEGACEYELSAAVKAPLTDKSLPFWDRFEAKYGQMPFYTSVGSYDTVFILKEAIERAGSTDPDDMVAALEQTDYSGAVGRMQFDDRHEPRNFILPYGQWRDGEKVPVWPQDSAEATYKLPPWLET